MQVVPKKLKTIKLEERASSSVIVTLLNSETRVLRLTIPQISIIARHGSNTSKLVCFGLESKEASQLALVQ